MSRKQPTSEGEESVREEWKEFLLGNKSITDVLAHSNFRQRVKMICFRFRFSVFNGVYGPEDLFQDTYFKILKYENELRRADNIPDVEAFFKWVNIAVLNTFRTVVRQHSRQQLESLGSPEGSRLRTIVKTPAEILAEIAALPSEGATDEFSGRGHDSILYPRK